MFYDADFDLSVFGQNTKDPALVNLSVPLNAVVCNSISHFAEPGDKLEGVVDMEAYSIVALCKTFHVPFDVYKVVSDGANSKEFESNVNRVIKDKIDELITKIGD